MSTKIKITVTKEILEKSKYCGIINKQVSENCAFSLAVRELFPNASVKQKLIFPNGYNSEDGKHFDSAIQEMPIETISFSIPYNMTSFIDVFDECLPLERVKLPEQSFELDIPDWALPNVDIEALLKDSKTLQLITS